MSRDDSYAVLACAHCQDYFLISGDWRSLETVSCSLCGTTRPTETYRQVAEHPEREGAAELRARQRARDAGHGPEYAGVDDYGVLGDQLREQDQPVVDPSESSPHSPGFYETAAETAYNRHRDAFGYVSDCPIGTDWFAEAASNAGVDHPGEDVVDELVSEQVVPDLDDVPALPDAGGLTLTTDTHISPAHSATVDSDTLAPTALQTALFGSRDIVDALIDSMQCLVADCPVTQDVMTYLCEQGVTALDGAYARLVAQAASGLAAGDQTALWRLFAVTRSLGGQTELDLGSSLDDVEHGPIALLALADESPTVEFRLDHSFFDVKSTRRRRFFRHLCRLTPGFEVRIVGSRLTLRQVLDSHGDELPTSVSEDAHQRLRSRETASTITEQRAQAAVDALEELGLEHPAWDMLVSIAEARRERRSYDELDEQTDVSRSALRRRIKRLRDAALVETLTINGETVARMTPIGQIALDRYPSLREDWSTDSEQTPLQNRSPPEPDVSDPRKSHHSTVVGQDRRGRRGETAPPSADRPNQETVQVDDGESPLQTDHLSLPEHHSTAAAVSNGHIGLIERRLSEDAVDRDHRTGRFSYDSDREEIVVSVDFSQTIALTAVRLCAALLSDQAFAQVLTTERIAENGKELGGLPIQNLVVLRDASCLGWLPDGTTAGGLRSRLQEARNNLLELGSTEFNSETLRDLLRDAHGLLGTALRLFEMLGVEVILEIQFPSGVPRDEKTRGHLGQFIAKASSIGSCYGAYSSHRVLHEDRDEKRQQLLSQPDVRDPEGSWLGSWVLTGEGVDDLADVLLDPPKGPELQEDGENFAAFQLRGAIVDGNRRSAVAETAVRVLSFTDGLRPDRQAISVLAALAGDVKTAGEALGRLGGEDTPRPLDMQDLRWGLSQVPAERLVPDCGGAVVSDVIGVLLNAQEQLSTAEVADRAGRSRRSLTTAENAKQFAQFEAMGLLSREDRGAGRATLWRLQLSFRRERRGEDCVVPQMIAGAETTPSGGEWHCTNALLEVVTTAADEFDVEYRFSFGGEAALAAFCGPPPVARETQPLLRTAPAIEPVLSTLATLLDQERRLPSSQPELELGKDPAPDQSTLNEAVA